MQYILTIMHTFRALMYLWFYNYDSYVALRHMNPPKTGILPHLPLDEMSAISLTIFSDAFSLKKYFVFLFKFCSSGPN